MFVFLNFVAYYFGGKGSKKIAYAQASKVFYKKMIDLSICTDFTPITGPRSSYHIAENDYFS